MCESVFSSELEAILLGGLGGVVPEGAAVGGCRRHHVHLWRVHIEHFHDVVLLFEHEVLLEQVCRLLVHLLILRELQVLQFVKEAALLDDADHGVDTIGVEQVVPAALHDKVESFKGNDEEARLFRIEDRTDCPDDALVNHLFDLLRGGVGRRI